MSEPQIDIRPDHWAIVRDILQRHVPQYAVWAFGSRAKWTAKEYSDLDLAIITDSPLPLATSAALAEDFSESDLPWKVDIVDWAETSETFKRIIERDRVVVQELLHSEISNGRKILLLEDCLDALIDYRGKTPRKTDYGIPLITAKVIKSGRIETPDEFIAEEDYSGWMTRGLPKVGDVVLTTEAPLGEVAQIKFLPVALAQRVVTLRGRKNILDNNFLLYLLQSPDIQEKLIGRSSGTTVIGIKQSELRKVEVTLPPLREQRAIAHILGTIDEKIELNRRMSETLEAMVCSLFKSLFVDFDGVSKEDLQKTEFGLIPKGWKVSNVGREVNVVGGSTPSTKDDRYWSCGTYNWATPKDLSPLEFPVLLNTDRKITQAGIEKITSGLLPTGTLLLSSRAPIGYLAIAEIPTAINQGFIAMKCDGALSNLFMLHWCRENMDAIIGNANGSTFLEISKSNFRPLPIIVPDKEELHKFEQRAIPLHQRIVENERQSQALTQLRDTLLPKLISGEVRIKDAERLAETA